MIYIKAELEETSSAFFLTHLAIGVILSEANINFYKSFFRVLSLTPSYFSYNVLYVKCFYI